MYGGILFSDSPWFRLRFRSVSWERIDGMHTDGEWYIGQGRAWYNKNVVGWVIEYRKGRLNYPGYLRQCMVGRVSYLGKVKQGNYHTHVLYTVQNPNYTLPKPYPFIITYPIHHPTLGTQTGRVLPCASINTTLPWIPIYHYPCRTKNELRLSNLSIQHCLKLISILCFS